MVQLARGPLRIGDLKECSAFVRMRDVLVERVSRPRLETTANLALEHALERLGYFGGGRLHVPPREAAKRIENAITQTSATKTYYLPLDCADDLPSLSFGPARFRRFEWQELREISASFGRGGSAAAITNCRQLAQFQWLTVREAFNLPDGFWSRASLIDTLLDHGFAGDGGSIEPHAERFPAIVETTLGALLTLPWESFIECPTIEWRPFRLPWVHVCSDDLYARLSRLPDAGTLSWEPYVSYDVGGDEIVDERPERWSIAREAEHFFVQIGDALWDRYRSFTEHVAARRPITHFLVRGFMAEGVDEFIAHTTTIETVVGMRVDHDRDQRPKLPDGKNPGATKRTAFRVAALLGDPSAYGHFNKLYRLRSAFIHGSAMRAISGKDKLLARSLSRRCVAACMDDSVFQKAQRNYDAFLDELMITGHGMVQQSGAFS